MATMTFKEASAFVITVGKNKGRTIDGVASTDRGLRYLDWLRGVRSEAGMVQKLDEALDVYLNDGTIQSELKAILKK